jgi:hypothetical protein
LQVLLVSWGALWHSSTRTSTAAGASWRRTGRRGRRSSPRSRTGRVGFHSGGIGDGATGTRLDRHLDCPAGIACDVWHDSGALPIRLVRSRPRDYASRCRTRTDGLPFTGRCEAVWLVLPRSIGAAHVGRTVRRVPVRRSRSLRHPSSHIAGGSVTTTGLPMGLPERAAGPPAATPSSRGLHALERCARRRSCR